MAGPAHDHAPTGQSKWPELERNWRRVASTHTLQELMTEHRDPTRPSVRLLLLGVLLVVMGVASLVLATFVMVVAPLLPPSKLVAVLQADKYYQLLIPLTIPVTIFTIFLNWFSMKLFKHNS